MSKPSKSSSQKKAKKLNPARPIDAAIWKRAGEIAANYSIVVTVEPAVGGYFGRGVEFPNVMSDGPTPEACLASVREALTLAVSTMLEDGEVPPTPNRFSDNRDQQVNVRLSSFERLVLEEAAQSRGYRGISDFMRAATLASVR